MSTPTPTPLVDAIAVGVRLIDENGKLQTSEEAAGLIQRVSSLFVVDLEMSGSSPLQHEILDIGARQTVIDHHRQASPARLLRSGGRKRQELERPGLLDRRYNCHDFRFH